MLGAFGVYCKLSNIDNLRSNAIGSAGNAFPMYPEIPMGAMAVEPDDREASSCVLRMGLRDGSQSLPKWAVRVMSGLPR
jgi:hypothetical protein